jgi:hypothetical protein
MKSLYTGLVTFVRGIPYDFNHGGMAGVTEGGKKKCDT